MMEKDKDEARNQLDRILKTELTTAFEPKNVNRHLELVELYLDAGMKDAARAEISRLESYAHNDPLVLATRIEMLVKEKRIKELSRLSMMAAKIPEPPLELRLAIAGGFGALRCSDQASSVYYDVLRFNKITPEAVHKLAEFVCFQPISAQLASELKEVAGRSLKSTISPLLAYILCRILTDMQECSEAEEYLSLVGPEEIDMPHITFDLAVLSFRLLCLDKAIAMAQRTLELSPEYDSAHAIIVTAHSFGDNLNEAQENILMMPYNYGPLLLTAQQVHAIIKYAIKQQKPQADLGVSILGSKREEKEQTINGDMGRPAAKPKGGNNMVTVSLLGGNRGSIGPWNTLMTIDRRYPHIIVQQLEDMLWLHAFIFVGKCPRWPWHEVPMSVEGQINLTDIKKLSFLSSPNFCPGNRNRDCSNKLFEEVENEIVSNPFLLEEIL